MYDWRWVSIRIHTHSHRVSRTGDWQKMKKLNFTTLKCDVLFIFFSCVIDNYNIILYLSRVFWGSMWPSNPRVLRERPQRCTLPHTGSERCHIHELHLWRCRCSWIWSRAGRLCSCTGREKSASTPEECCYPSGRVSRWTDNTHLREGTDGKVR